MDERAIFSTNYVETTGYPHGRKESWFLSK